MCRNLGPVVAFYMISLAIANPSSTSFNKMCVYLLCEKYTLSTSTEKFLSATDFSFMDMTSGNDQTTRIFLGKNSQ